MFVFFVEDFHLVDQCGLGWEIGITLALHGLVKTFLCDILHLEDSVALLDSLPF